ncbi:MAG: aminotransferase class V-fold PLP-dependent enzyme [Chloroflexota bacterium]
MHQDFLLDDEITFLNHGSFGACPRPVFETYQQWQRELERQPVAFLGRRYDALMDEARSSLAEYVGAAAQDLIFVPNVTVAINTVARAIPLEPGDEVLATDHEYGAVDLTWAAVCKKAGAHYIRQPIDTPLGDTKQVIETLWQAVTPRTRVIAISHITSPTALTFPVASICARAREAGILTVIDGAHAPGQIPLDVTAVGADFYTGNCHKWLCAPKGAGFLHARREHHTWLEPLVISWGYGQGEGFVARNQWQGTRDIAAYLSVPAAIGYQHARDWPTVQARCHDLALGIRDRIQALTGLPHLGNPQTFRQMVSLPLPVDDIEGLKARLYDDYRVEVPAIRWRDLRLIRLSVQIYNTEVDGDRLASALVDLLPHFNAG